MHRTCERGWKHTCITKLHCPDAGEWGIDFRTEEERGKTKLFSLNALTSFFTNPS